MPGRRGKGEGSIVKRTDGRWAAYATGLNGQRRYVYGKTRTDVAHKLGALTQQLSSGLPLPSGQETVASFLATWLEGRRSQLRPAPWRRSEEYVRIHIVPVIGNVKVSRLTPHHLTRLYESRLGAGLSTTSVHHLHATLHTALGQAVRWNLVPRNVADLVDPPRIRRLEMTVFGPDQVRVLLDAARGGPLEAIITVAVSTGMRRGELLALRWRDVDLDRSTVRVVGTLQRGFDRKLIIAEPKTSHSRRQVEISSLATDALRRHRATQTSLRLMLGEEWEDHDLVFPNQFGNPQDGGHLVLGQFVPLLKRAGLPRIRFHDLRHTAASLLLGRGVHPKIVSEMLGHATIGITLDLYSHATPTMHREAARTMDEVLRD
ncbi:MAG TPA: tyrosine-type recombinase/integrase [Candidatus Acidoferrum sp.]|nr:tyrosine-type recombinase/integrase [Candidatus Acidoferrum sp.]